MGISARLWGADSSSTRAEIAGGVVSLIMPGPVHLASDSLGFVTKANETLQKPSTMPKRPYSIQTDGDRWHIFHNVTLQKGPGSIRISWTKGHAKAAHILAGSSSPFQLIQNDQADATADFGISEGIGALQGL